MIGQLNELVEVQTPTTVDDGQGGSTTTWVKAVDLWANIRSSSGTEELQQGQSVHTVVHNLVTRYSTLVQPQDRIVIRDTPCVIESIVNRDMRNTWLDITCIERHGATV